MRSRTRDGRALETSKEKLVNKEEKKTKSLLKQKSNVPETEFNLMDRF